MSRPIIAILRGLKPEEAIETAAVLVEAGITAIEVPLNSPSPMVSIGKIISFVSSDIMIGAGTVLSVEQVHHLADIGGQMVVSPNCNIEVIKATKHKGMQSFPGILTPSECFAAIDAGADGLKFFPASQLGISGFKAYKAVLPTDTPTYAVGGAGPDNFDQWIKAGITGFGIGSALYKAGDSAETVSQKAKLIVSSYDQALATVST